MAQARFSEGLPGFTPEQLDRARALVARIAERRRQIARIEADIIAATQELATIADAVSSGALGSDGPEYARRSMTAEVAAATRVHPHTARAQMDEAERIMGDFPEAFDALSEGRISLAHARVVADAGGGLDPSARASLDSCAIPFAETRTPGDLRRITKKQAADLASDSPSERHEIARAERRVALTELDDGMSELHVVAPTFEARTIYDRLTRLSRFVKTDRRRARSAFIREHGMEPEEHVGPDRIAAVEGNALAASDRRTMDQLRADILSDILLTSAPTGHRLHASGPDASLDNVQAQVQVTIPAAQIVDPDSNAPSWLDEGALISSHTARRVAAHAAGWDRLFVRPETGEVVSVDRYRPSSEQKRVLRARDMTCRFPGCTTPARRSDIDHSHDYARGGRTDVENLSALCETHHMVKHAAGWTLVQLGGGVLEWLSPLGYTYRDEPASRAFFRQTHGLHGARHERTTHDSERRRVAREARREAQRASERRDESCAREDESRNDRVARFTQPPPDVDTGPR
ncbi:MAG: DUF222 domain-containing protein [Microbacterium gubbeenense]|uniref:HNH endonuclease signature motif containing protein n=1 Tax=Microbacterium gubbeenense TaxID=159896 RepID=UPI003F97C81C